MTTTAERHQMLQRHPAVTLQPLVQVECGQGGPCDVIEIVAPHLRTEGVGVDVPIEAWAKVARAGLAVPCQLCRVGVAELRTLSGLRLGRRERMVLLRASPAETGDSYHMARAMDIAGDTQQRRGWRDGSQQEWTVGSHSEQVATRRAAHKLETAGLVTIRYRCGLRVRLTFLGTAVVDDFRAALEGGGRIRWAAWIEAGALDLQASVADRVGVFAKACRQGAKAQQASVDWGERSGVPPVRIFQEMHKEQKRLAAMLPEWARAAEAAGGDGEAAP